MILTSSETAFKFINASLFMILSPRGKEFWLCSPIPKTGSCEVKELVEMLETEREPEHSDFLSKSLTLYESTHEYVAQNSLSRTLRIVLHIR